VFNAKFSLLLLMWLKMSVDDAIERFSKFAATKGEHRKDFSEVVQWLCKLKELERSVVPFVEAAPKSSKAFNLIWYKAPVPSMRHLYAGDFIRLKNVLSEEL